MTNQTRVPPTEIRGIYGAIAKWYSKRSMGLVPDSLGVMWHNLPVLKTTFGLFGKMEKWDQCDRQLKSFAQMAAVSTVGCSFCLDLGYFQAHNDNLDMEKARQVPGWRTADVFTPLERDVLEYAEAMSQTPPTVTDELSARLLEQLGAPALIELTACIGAANLTSRSNVALGITAQGIADACGLPPLPVPRTSAAAPA
ncbi:MAG: carboxymuconolactone decarboxylase family protein [Dehalococcoidia bacterium]|nr:carboxymuconolactone decarboxylase family protein [Dehalococcoidia bacterium]